jgi:hypothetical protein
VLRGADDVVGVDDGVAVVGAGAGDGLVEMRCINAD